MKYANYQVEDFLSDDYFVRWCVYPDADSNAFWQKLLRELPHQKPTIGQARALLNALQFDEEVVSQATVDAEWGRFKREQINKNRQGQTPVISLRSAQRWWWVAASVAGLLLGLFWWANHFPADQIYRTGFGQVRTLDLPDGSIVTLNANSEVRVPGNWTSRAAREVWLKGEGFFQVVKRAGQSQNRFLVHTGEASVEVLGTAFNVRSRHQQADVLLQSGSVRLQLMAADTIRSLLMRPGDGVHFRPSTGQIDHRLISPERIGSWTKGVLLLDQMTLKELGQMIEDTYGRRVVIRSPELAHRMLSGSLPTSNEQALLAGIAITLNVPVQQENGLVIFGK